MSDNRRDQLIEFVEREFIGPDPIDWPGMTQSNGQEILASDPPRTRYIAGILYPAETTDDKADLKDDECELLGESDGEDVEVKPQKLGDGIVEFLEDAEELINRSNAYRQSAISITVSVKDGDAIRVAVSAGTYTKVPAMDPATGERLENKYKYPRTALAWENDNAPLILPTPTDGLKKFPIGTTGLQFDITYRYRTDDSCIYTFTLENAKPKVKENVSDEECFFQCKFKLFSEKGFSPLSDSQRITQDEDYQSNQLLYRNVRNYAIGHGCAADWDDSESVLWITTAIFPKYDIKPIVPSAIKGVSLDMLKMSPYGSFADTIRELRMMCAKYREWINGLRTIRQDLSTEYKITADRHITNCETCLSRMEKGVELLEQNENIRIAFQYMNLAMLMQQLHYNLPLQKWEDNGAGDISLVNPVSMPVVTDDSTWHNKEQRVYGKWRPFQLAFVLMNLRAMYDRDCNERGIVDLIWFPTGGGKTEAYLGLSAYTIFIRRLMNKDDKGTAILMRYTLRLLTAQQYERASAMICACDLIRKSHEDLFGKNRITIGLWVGSSTTPNKVSGAVKAYEKLYRGEGSNPFVMLKCPWCGAQMGPVQKGKNQWELPGYRKVPLGRRRFGFAFRCRNHQCDFSTEDLPLFVVDESIYEETPTLLLGTVDKFAMLPFRPNAQKIFGYENGVKKTSPDLIIQDELHLISGPLGSMVGHYETLIHELCISGSEVTASLANLGIRYPGEVDSEGKIKEHPIDICLATNMISVGLDVSRLGLMTVAGQPKTTSEYIQATSRVGRDAENAPGLVFVLYRPGRPRDKSHYEQFRSYHSRVYCNVEPTSVTPFSAPVRERALHAIMVGMMRLESDDRFNEDPPRFPNDGLIDKVRSVIENRVDDIDSEELDATLNRMEYILQCWEDWNPRKWEPAKNPDWSYADPVPLMYSAGSHPNEAWGSRGIETPTSMRSVDASCEAEVLTNRYVPKEG